MTLRTRPILLARSLPAVVRLAAAPAFAGPAPGGDLDLLSASLRVRRETLEGVDAQADAEIDEAAAVLTADHATFSRRLKRTAGALARLDKVLGGQTVHEEQADIFLEALRPPVGTANGQGAAAAATQKLVSTPLELAEVSKQIAKRPGTAAPRRARRGSRPSRRRRSTSRRCSRSTGDAASGRSRRDGCSRWRRPSCPCPSRRRRVTRVRPRRRRRR